MDGITVTLAKGENKPAAPGPFSPCGTPFQIRPTMEASKPARKKSERRRRKAPPFQVRLNDQERQALDERAASAGLAVPDYFRVTCLDAKPLRKVKERTPARRLLVQVETALNRIGGNVNQIAAKVNSSGFITRAEMAELKYLIAEAHKQIERFFPVNDDLQGD